MSAWWTRAEIQESLALGLVGLVTAVALLRWWLRRHAAKGECGGCETRGRCPIAPAVQRNCGRPALRD